MAEKLLDNEESVKAIPGFIHRQSGSVYEDVSPRCIGDIESEIVAVTTVGGAVLLLGLWKGDFQ
jgi:hypothetical protein